MIDLKNFGKGAIPALQEKKNGQYRLSAQAPKVINWNKPWRDEFLTVLNQGSSSACTAFAAAQYCMGLEWIKNGKKEDYSRRFIYSQSNLGLNQGAYIWKSMGIPLKGLASENSVPDGLTEVTETDPSLNANANIEARAEKYAQLSNNHQIDYLAGVLDEFVFFQTGFNGNDDIMQTPVIGIPTHVDWGHSVLCTDYGLINGVKVIKFINSWTDQWGQRGYGFFSESFVGSGYLFDPYVYANLTDLDPTSMFLLKQVPGSSEVWLVKNSKKTHVYNQGALLSISEFANITPITQVELDAIPDSGLELATLVKE